MEWPSHLPGGNALTKARTFRVQVPRLTTTTASSPGHPIFWDFPNPPPATMPPPRSHDPRHSPPQAKARPLSPSHHQRAAPARPLLQTDKGYQHHGFSCFFFLRPITAPCRQSKREEIISRKNKAKIALSLNPTATTAFHRKQTQNGRHPRLLVRLPSGTSAKAVSGEGHMTPASSLNGWRLAAAEGRPPSYLFNRFPLCVGYTCWSRRALFP